MSIHTSIHTGLLGAMVAAVVAGITHVAATRAAETPGSIHGLTIITTDFSFDAPDTVPAGLTRIRLRNKGSEHHHAQLVRLRDGGTIQELLDTLGTRMTNVPPGTRYLGGPNVPPAGGWSEVTVQLEPGRYALICFVSGADHVAHMRKGMTRLLTVKAGRPADRAASPEPTLDSRMVLHDYAFDIKPAIRPGRRVIRVENAAAQPHEAVIGRLAPGKTAADLLTWMSKRDGPMPGEEIGGTVVLSPGEVNYVTADFTPGDYILLCFVRDVKDGKSHLAHGMIRPFRVEAGPSAAGSSSFAWSGVFDLVATGYPDGDRTAVMQIAKTNTGYSLVSLEGPPGKLVRMRIAGDSAHIRWHLGTDVMVVELRGVGDSLSGQWSTSEWSGWVNGIRRR